MPHAKLVYVSATGASSVRGLAPMPRLGLWGTAAAPFADFKVLPLTPTLPLITLLGYPYPNLNPNPTPTPTLTLTPTSTPT